MAWVEAPLWAPSSLLSQAPHSSLRVWDPRGLLGGGGLAGQGGHGHGGATGHHPDLGKGQVNDVQDQNWLNWKWCHH